jgi:hypothetical protein
MAQSIVSDLPGMPSVGPVKPIYGCGDFSSFSYWDLDWTEITALKVQCANDDGVPARALPPGDGVTRDRVNPEQHAMARAILDACRAGLRMPPPETPSEAQLAELHEHLVEVKEWLEAEGYAMEPPLHLALVIESTTRVRRTHTTSSPISTKPSGRGSTHGSVPNHETYEKRMSTRELLIGEAEKVNWAMSLLWNVA